MKAVFVDEPGPLEGIRVGDLPVREPSGAEVLVKVGAVAVNPIDTYIRSGAVAVALPKPFILGCDLAGTVETTGPAVTRFKPGDRVWGSNQGQSGRQGTFAEFATVDECWLYPTPDVIDDIHAAAIALVGITSHLGLVREANLQAGETLFIQGGTGGIGSTVVQMARAIGARVITTAGTDDKVEACRALGADLALNYRTDGILDAVQHFAPDGVDVYWETTREPDFDRAIGLLAPRGRMIVMAGRDARPPFPVGPFYVKGCSLHGFAMFRATPDEQRICADAISRWMTEGKLAARIDRVLPLDDTAAAHRLQEENTLGGAGTLAGKIVLTP